MSTPRIDAHHHFWAYNPEAYAWIDESMAVNQRDFLPVDLEETLRASQLDAAISVQARTIPEETDWLLGMAEQHSFIAGVVGWAPFRDPDVGERLEAWAAHPACVGMREVAQGEPEGFLLDDAFNRGVAEVGRVGLAYDILIFENQLEEAVRFVDRHPTVRFVVDHIAKPRIAEGAFDGWAKGMKALSEREQVWVKVSGMVTEADWDGWTPEQLQPYLDEVFSVFGPKRLLFGSDWPVCRLGCSHQDWTALLRQYTASLSVDEQALFWGGAAMDAYQLPQ